MWTSTSFRSHDTLSRASRRRGTRAEIINYVAHSATDEGVVDSFSKSGLKYRKRDCRDAPRRHATRFARVSHLMSGLTRGMLIVMRQSVLLVG